MKSSDLDVNMSLNKEEDTALHKAAEAGNLEAVRILVTVAKADVNKENKNGEKPIDKAKKGGEVIGYLKTRNPQAPLSS